MSTNRENKKEINKKEGNNMKTTFKDLLKTYADSVNTGNKKAYEKVLTELATAVTYSVLKKCIDVSCNEQLKKIRIELTRDINNLKSIAYANDNAYKFIYNSDGDLTKTINDKNAAELFGSIACESLGDGLDLVNTAVIAILDETRKQAEREPGKPVDLERPYTARQLKRKVYIKKEDGANSWETAETSPIKTIYNSVRREIYNNKSLKINDNGYTYLAELVTDSDSNTTETAYRRLNKYADLGGYATDFNGACTLYTTNPETVNRTDAIIERLELTAKQVRVLALRQSGYGYRAIATYLGVTPQAVIKTVQAIQKKAESIGFYPDMPLK